MTKEELLSKKVSAISLGCDKNRVDLEHMLFAIKEYGFDITDELEEAEIIIVNTCAFIQPAILEAIENIELAISLKQTAKAEKVIVCGCLPMREMAFIKENFQQVDAFLTLKDNVNIISYIEDLYSCQKEKFVFNPSGRVITNQGNYTYLKIAEGCSNGCAYCTIPRIRGRFASVPPKQLIAEAKRLVSFGYKELIIVAQDTARYGEDLFGEPRLIALLKDLRKIKNLEWIRLQYIYPEWLTTELLDFIKNTDKMCKYLDVPLQHIDDDILKKMNRRTGEEKTRSLIKNIKENYPEITLRSTFIIGFPTETRAKFNKLCKFIEEGNITYASFFPYYREEKTKAYFMRGQISNFTKKRRVKKIESLQNKALNKINLKKINTVEEVLVDSYDEQEKIFVAHSKNSSPNIDLCVILEQDNPQNIIVEIGQIYKVKLTQMLDCGFKGEII